MEQVDLDLRSSKCMRVCNDLHPRSLYGPIVIIVVGTLLLLHQFVPQISIHRLWPLLLIGIGVAGLLSRRG